jgi:hypothetical protein
LCESCAWSMADGLEPIHPSKAAGLPCLVWARKNDIGVGAPVAPKQSPSSHVVALARIMSVLRELEDLRRTLASPRRTSTSPAAAYSAMASYSAIAESTIAEAMMRPSTHLALSSAERSADRLASAIEMAEDEMVGAGPMGRMCTGAISSQSLGCMVPRGDSM